MQTLSIDKNIQTLSIDIETYCEKNLSQCGVYAYCDDDSFEILLFAYAFNNEETKIIDLANNEKLPQEVIDALYDNNTIKTAFNAVFERVCLSKYLNKKLSPTSWNCTQAQGAVLGLPLSLEKMGQVLNIESKKLKEGKELIKYFSLPCRPTNSNNNRKRNLPHHDIEKWESFKKYCIGDVNAERGIRQILRDFPMIDSEMEIYKLDQKINDRGIGIDYDFVNQAIKCHDDFKEEVTARAYKLTGMENPNSLKQLKNYLNDHGIDVEKLDRKTVKKLIETSDDEVKEVLQLRLLMSKTSIKKYKAIEKSICKDKRVHGLFQYYGATRTGRWAGRLVQVQNLPQNHIENLQLARNLVKSGQYEDIELFYDSTPEVLSQLIRTAFVPKEGCEFIVADFSSIEARVLAWISNEKWRLEVFKTHGKIYESSASEMFGVPIEKIDKTSDLRQKGKIAELALGYGGSQGALISMGSLEMGLNKDELIPLVNKWRRANPAITKFWWDIGNAAITAVKKGREVKMDKVTFTCESGIFFIKLPSGRSIAYAKPRLEINKFNRIGLTYKAVGTNKKWTTIETYGPKLVENIVQAISRDILAYVMLNLEKRGFNIVMHVHDEVVLEVEKNTATVEEICNMMAILPSWAEDLPIKAEGYKCEYYQK